MLRRRWLADLWSSIWVSCRMNCKKDGTVWAERIFILESGCLPESGRTAWKRSRSRQTQHERATVHCKQSHIEFWKFFFLMRATTAMPSYFLFFFLNFSFHLEHLHLHLHLHLPSFHCYLLIPAKICSCPSPPMTSGSPRRQSGPNRLIFPPPCPTIRAYEHTSIRRDEDEYFVTIKYSPHRRTGHLS